MLYEQEVRIEAFEYYTRLQRVKQYVDDNLHGGISLQQAADQAGLEKKYFSTYFRAKTGLCFSVYLTRQRIRQAKRMLLQRDHSVTEVAFAVGYQDLTTFERAFKRCTEMTPRAFRSAAQLC